VLDKIEGFDWDTANVDHILRHDVTPIEVEEITGGTYVIIPATTVKREKRWSCLAKRHPGDSWSSCSAFAGNCSAP
jgi:hypothetical protein